MIDPADAVLRFLDGVGRRQEAAFYLGLFRGEAKERFATISVDSWVARHALDAVVHDLSFLAAMGLTPVVVLGLIEPTLADEHAARLARRLGRNAVESVVLPSAHTSALADEAAAAARAGKIPIIPFDVADGATVDARFARLGALLASLASRKLIFLIRRGGLRAKDVPVPLVNLTTEYESTVASKELSRRQQILVTQSRRLVFDLVPHKLTIAITSPIDLLRELFTVRGAGTLLRRGAVIARKSGLADVDQLRLRALIESAFGRQPVDSFFGRTFAHVYVEEQYRGAAIVADTQLGAYLTKFAVDREAQGEGMGRDLWELVVADHPTVFWRARATNPIATWYAQQCDGMCRFPDWHVFWKGLAPEQIPAAIAYALTAPIDIPT